MFLDSVYVLTSFFKSALLIPGLGAVKWSSDQVSSAVPVEDQSFATGEHPATKADLSPTKGGEAMVGGEAWAGKPLRQECWEGLGGKLTSRTTEAWVTSEEGRNKERRE